jgi:hypothetical protein
MSKDCFNSARCGPDRAVNSGLKALEIERATWVGVLATATTRITRHADRRTTIRAGLCFAAIWVAAIGGRIAFAELATHAWGPAVARLSMAHQITGADAWRITYVLMSVAMVLGRVASTVVRIARTPAVPGPARVAAPVNA